jgi:hypothetical protein
LYGGRVPVQTSPSGEGSPPARPRTCFFMATPSIRGCAFQLAHASVSAGMDVNATGSARVTVTCWAAYFTAHMQGRRAPLAVAQQRPLGWSRGSEAMAPRPHTPSQLTNGHSGAQQTLSRCLWLRSTAADLLGRAGGELWGPLRGTIKTIEGRISNAHLPTAPQESIAISRCSPSQGPCETIFCGPPSSMHRPGAQMKSVNCAGRPVPSIVSSSG